MGNSSQPLSEPMAQPGFSRQGCLLAIGILMTIVAYVAVSDSKKQRYWGELSQCHHNARDVANALGEYRKKWGSPPPLYTTNKDGDRLHSWRTLLLPYLGHAGKNMYADLRLDEAWDSKHNREVANRHEHVAYRFQCPIAAGWHRAETSNTTSFLAISGQGQRWGRRIKRHAAVQYRQPTDPVVLLVTEVRNSSIHWMNPTDISITSPNDAFNKNAKVQIGSNHSDGLWKWIRKPFHVIAPAHDDGKFKFDVRRLDALTEMQLLKDQISGSASLFN